jgi:hypothetical protein
LKKAKPVVGATGFEVGDFFLQLSTSPMEKKPNDDDGYVVIVVRLPTKLLTQLGRWLVVAASTYVLLHQ